MRELRALMPAELALAEPRLLNPAPGSRIAAAKDIGIDLTLLLQQLRLDPAERARQNAGTLSAGGATASSGAA